MDTIIKFTKENYAELDVQKLDGGTVTVTSPVIIRIDGDTIKTLGTAFCVGLTQAGVGIYITARHVIDVLTSYPEGYEPFVLIAEKVNHPQIGNYGYGRIQQICVVNQPFDLSLMNWLFVIALTNLATAIPSAPAGFGTFHGAAVGSLLALGAGISPDAAAAYALVLHASQVLPITSIGAASYFRLSLRGAKSAMA